LCTSDADDAGGPTERLTIDSSGNVLFYPKTVATLTGDGVWIGPTGQTWFTATSDNPIGVNRKTGDGKIIQFLKDGVAVGTINVDASSTAYNTSSDYRLKENVTPLTGAIDRLNQLKPSRFNFVSDPEIELDGFLAHEVSNHVPEAISGEKDAMKTEEYEVTPAVEKVRDDEGNVTTEAVPAVMGEREVPDMQGIDQSKLVPLLVGALQEAITRIETLENA